MTMRSILAGKTPSVIIRTGNDVTVEGWDEERVSASTDSRWGLKVERKHESEIGRIRAKVGDRILLDMGVKVPAGRRKTGAGEVIQVEIGGSGKIHVSRTSNLKVYAGKSVEVSDIGNSVAVYAGGNVILRNVHSLVHASAGGAMDLDCEEVEGNDRKFEAGRDLRFYIRSLTNATVMINDAGGYWEVLLGDGRTKVRLTAGGDVTLVTDQEVRGRPPSYILGRIEKPGSIPH